MKIDKKVEQMIALGMNPLKMTLSEYKKLKDETKNLIKYNKLNVIIEEKK